MRNTVPLRIPAAVAAKIGYYVYVYSDPRSRKPFYVGKGRGSRVLAHAQGLGSDRTEERLRSIRRAGLEPRIDILAHGLADAETALRVEAAVIDLLGLSSLSNAVRGWRSVELGRMPLRQLVAYYAARPVKVRDLVILIRVNQLYQHGMSAQALYEITRGIWRLNPERASNAKYALAVFEGVVREVYEISQWVPAGSTKYKTRNNLRVPGRWEFTGKVAPDPIRRRYVDRSVASYFTRGSQAPFTYVGR
ncbi:MAG: hypothetical protein EXR82_10015 [Gammaproteobacteria bacterium]|nr:hypothetical protein [Gammaproteobacteria bacterium]